MTDDMDYDLAKELRESAKATFYDPLKSELNEAASHIEKLEAALRIIVGALEDPTGGQHVSDMRHASDTARKALEKKDD